MKILQGKRIDLRNRVGTFQYDVAGGPKIVNYLIQSVPRMGEKYSSVSGAIYWDGIPWVSIDGWVDRGGDQYRAISVPPEYRHFDILKFVRQIQAEEIGGLVSLLLMGVDREILKEIEKRGILYVPVDGTHIDFNVVDSWVDDVI